MSLEDDRKRGQALSSAKQLVFNDPEMQQLIASPQFTTLRCRVQLNRLIANAESVRRKNTSGEMSDEDAAILRDGNNAQELLAIIDRPLDGSS